MDSIERENIQQMTKLSVQVENLRDELRRGFKEVKESLSSKADRDEVDNLRSKVNKIESERRAETRERENKWQSAVIYLIKIILPVVIGSATVAVVIYNLLIG